MMRTALKETLKRSAAFIDDREGATAIVMGVLAPVLLFGIAFGSEVASWEMTKRRMQNAADVAAFAAAKQVAAEYDGDIPWKAADYIARKSGVHGDAAVVSVANPPVDAPEVRDPDDASKLISPNGDDQYVHVIVEQPVKRNFSRMFVNVFGGNQTSSSQIIIRSEAIAYLDNGNAGNACVLSLSKTASGAVEVWGSTTVTLGGCQIAANSNSTSAFKMGGSGIMSADCIHVVGDTDIDKEENLTLNECAAAKTGASEVADPYASAAEPTPPATCNLKFADAPKTDGWKQATPGCYSGSQTFNNDKYKLNTGGDNIYYLNGGTFTVNGNAEVEGEGVMLYLYNGAQLKLNGGAKFSVSSMGTGPYAGLAVFYSRSTTGTTKINGDSGFNVKGAIYAAGADIEFSGNTSGTSTGECLQVIGNTVKMTGNSNFYTDCAAYGTKVIEVEGGTDSISIVG